MMCVWATPSSSSISQLIIPIQSFQTFAPPNPLMDRLHATISPGILDLTFVMHADHLLSTPTNCNPVSNGGVSAVLWNCCEVVDITTERVKPVFHFAYITSISLMIKICSRFHAPL